MAGQDIRLNYQPLIGKWARAPPPNRLLRKCLEPWPGSFLRSFLTSSREIKTQKNNDNNKIKKEANLWPTCWTSLVNKWFIIWLNWRTFACGTSGIQHLARSGRQSECMIIRFILPACEFSHVKRNCLFIDDWNIASPTENSSLLLNTLERLIIFSL